MERLLFVLGTGRCGSTLLEQILATHPEIGWVSDLPRGLARVGRTLRYRRRSETYDVIEQHVSPMLVAPFRDLTAEDAAPWLERRLRRFFEERARRENRPVFMYKFTGWPRARLLAAVFPEARFIHVVRDGRSVANSYVQVRWWQGYQGVPGWTFGHLSEQEHRQWEQASYSWPYLAGLEWKRLLDAFEAARAEVGPERWLDVRYEDLVARPREETATALRFVGLDAPEGLDREISRLKVTAGRADAYLDELRPEDVILLDSLLGPTLARWGYATREAA
jgi:hypothetical protein